MNPKDAASPRSGLLSSEGHVPEALTCRRTPGRILSRNAPAPRHRPVSSALSEAGASSAMTVRPSSE